MTLSAANQLKASIKEIKTGAVNSLIVCELANKKLLKATVTVDSQNDLDLKPQKDVWVLFKATSVIIAKDNALKLSAANQLDAVIQNIVDGAVNSEITMQSDGITIRAIITKESANSMSLKVGDSVKAVIKATQIVLGV